MNVQTQQSSNRVDEEEEDVEDEMIVTSWEELPTHSLYPISGVTCAYYEHTACRSNSPRQGTIKEHRRSKDPVHVCSSDAHHVFGQRELLCPLLEWGGTVSSSTMDDVMKYLADAVEIRVKDLPVAKE